MFSPTARYTTSRSTIEPLEKRMLCTVTPDPGSDFAHAFNVGELNGKIEFGDTVGPSDTADIYRFVMPRGGMFFGRLRAFAAHAEIDLIQEQVDPNGDVHEVFVDFKTATQDGPDAGFSSGDLPGRFLQAGTYFIIVNRLGGDTPYLMRMTADYAGETMSAARNIGIATDATFQDFVGSFPTPSLTDPSDFYKVKMDAAGKLITDFSVDNPNGDTFLGHIDVIKDVNGNGAIDPGDLLNTSVPSTSQRVTNSLDAGTYFIRVVTDTNFFNYHLRVTADYAGHEAGENRITGPLDAGKTFQDFISASEDQLDNYQFSVSTARPLNLVFREDGGGKSELVVYKDANNDGVGQDNELILLTDDVSFTNVLTLVNPGNYIAQVIGKSGGGTYELFAAAPPDAAGNSLAAAKNLGTVNGLTHAEEFVGGVDVNDFYKFTASAAGKVGIRLDSEIGDADLALIRDANNNGRIDTGDILVSSTRTGALPEEISKPITPGTYFVRVTDKVFARPTKYFLSVQTDYAGETPATARNVGTLAGTRAFDDWASGPFGGVISDTSDLYKFNLASTRTLTAKLTGSHSGQDLALQLFKDKNNNGKIDAGELVAAVDHPDSPNEQLIKSLASGTYFARVVGVNGETNYDLSLKA